MSMYYNDINYDYNDNVYLISNMRPASPPAPTGLASVNLSTGVSLDWNDNTDKTTFAYNVYRSTTSGGTYARINAAAVINSEYLDTTAAVGVTYYYKVSAIDNWGARPHLEPLAEFCFDGDLIACDDLYELSPSGLVGSYRDYGRTCGLRVTISLAGRCESRLG